MANNIAYEATATGFIVWLDRKTVGKIKKVEGGYQYLPKGSKTGGEIFPTVELVKQSLEAE